MGKTVGSSQKLKVFLSLVVLVLIGSATWHVSHSKTANKPGKTTMATQQQTLKNPLAGWRTYTANSYAAASGISVKYPPGWKVNVGDMKAYAWEIVQTASPKVSINIREIYLSEETTPQQEWNNCLAKDACGSQTGSTTLSESTASINGLAAYTVKMQDIASTTYYVTIIKANVSNSNGRPFVEFAITNPSAENLKIFNEVTGSAHF